MIPKKNPALDYNHLRPLFLSIGLATSMLMVTAVFEWKTYESAELVELAAAMTDQYEDVLEIPPTNQPPPPPPKIIQPEIIAVADEIEIDDLEISLDIEIHESTAVEEREFSNVIEEPEEEMVDEIFVVVEQFPEPVGGMIAFYQYVQENMKYPGRAQKMRVEGKVFIQFIVFPDGSIQDIQAIKGIGSGCDEEALRVVKESPIEWIPGKQRGVPVKVKMVLPITFKLKG
ncbi:energy transducer TonB [Tunicatimonas pelagia]|uniref:energy transducer TonB n=1 Tax=Tunicatimonas pelagia TaxID=931531 RepID=UPI00266500BD|nr:energy transducer TonB [Tunicatimonas pelagia]WKN45538.1 energy transducer TonB [Tunicatimonas pelagia]